MKLVHSVVALFLAVPLLLSPATATQLNITGDPQAWQRVLSVYERFEQLKTYRMRFRNSAAILGRSRFIFPRAFVTFGKTTVEIFNPDRARYEIQVSIFDLVAKKVLQQTYERIEVGTEAAHRVSGEKDWQCTAPWPRPDIPVFSTLKQQLSETVGVDVHALGQVAALEGYEYILLFKDPERRLFSERLLIRGDGDLPERIQDFTLSGDEVSDVQFGDFNAPIEIVLPKCGM